jgi:phosphoribosyl 1,2-cyclic phosphodiesterase
VPHADMMGIGGNTACVEVRLSSDDILLIDCGTGARAAGKSLQQRMSRKAKRIHILFSHFHWDHIQGLPFFAPLYLSTSNISFYSHKPAKEMAKILERQMANPWFPSKLSDVPAQMSFNQISNRGLVIGDAHISSFPLHHPQGAWGYRVDCNGRSLVYASDHEHGSVCDKRLSHAAQNADVLIYDAQLTPSEYPDYQGWGHSTWLEGAQTAKRAGVKKLVLFHHSPDRKDIEVEKIVSRARRVFPAVIAAKESLVLQL